MKISLTLCSTVSAVASVAVLALGAPATGQAIRDKPPLTIATYGGAYTKSQMKAYILPFRKASRRWVEVVEFSGGLGQIRQQVKTLNVKWDLVDIELAHARRACEEGLLEPIDPAILKPAPDGTPAEQDFYPAALRRCSIGHVAISLAIAYKPSAFDGVRPNSLADFFNVEKFPGKRGVRKAPSPNLEWALMAAGVFTGG